MADKIRILHIDDNQMDRELVYDALAGEGNTFSVTGVSSWDEFIQRLKAEPFDVVLTDFNIAGIQGLDVLEHVRRHHPNIPVIILTGTGTEEIAARSIKDGAADYVLKTVRDIRHLEKTILAVLEANHTQQQLDFKNAILATQQESTLDGILVVSPDEDILSWNRRFIEIWGIPQEVIDSRSDRRARASVRDKLKDPEGFERGVEYLRMHPQEHTFDEIELRDGRTLERYSVPLVGDDDTLFGRVWYFRDITERKSSETRILRLNHMHSILSAINSLIVRARNRDTLFRETCRIAVEIGDFRLAWIGLADTRTELIVPRYSAGNDRGHQQLPSITWIGPGRTNLLYDRLYNGKQPVFVNDIRADPYAEKLKQGAIDRGCHAVAALPLIKDNTTVGILVLYAPEPDFFDEEERSLLSKLAEDISYAMQNLFQRERLDYLERYDSLTGLSNWSTFQGRLSTLLDEHTGTDAPVTLILFNIRHLRYINNTYGIQAGDTLLSQLAKRLGTLMENEQDIARTTADTFVLVLLQDKDTAVQFYTEQVLPPITAPYTIDDQEVRIELTGAIASHPDDGDTVDQLYQNSETALNRARLKGKPYLVFLPEMKTDVTETMQLQNELQGALLNNEFILHYQPRVNLATGQICGVEALIRWDSPQRGLVPPDRFIPELEQSGLIVEVGKWALQRAASDWNDWQKQLKSAPRVAVYISPQQLGLDDFHGYIQQTVNGFTPRVLLDIKITESQLMFDIQDAFNKLGEIRNAGIGIIIDDFGTGYSSLSYIARLPADYLKIDRSFIMTMTDRPESMGIVSTIITLAHSLNFKVIAEGVETDEQARYLRLLRCDEILGYLYSKPLTAVEMLELLHKET